jgi:hypothetical protein
MHNTFPAILGLIVPLFLAATIATAAPSAKAAEDRYIAARDAAIEKISEALLHTECAKAGLLCGSIPADREAACGGPR